jgi:hypothetical protein
MGANIVRRVMNDGHVCVVYNRSPEPVRTLADEGATGTYSLDEFVAALEPPRVAWVMVPAAITGEKVEQLAGRMEPGDVIIDGGNSYYREDIGRADRLKGRGIHYLDIGTSGGVVRSRPWVLPDDRRRGGDGVVPRSSAALDRSWCPDGAQDAWARWGAVGRRAGVPALWPRRCWSLRQDGP